MTNERKETLLKTLFTDEAATKAALAMTPEQVQAALKEKGLDYTIDEINEVGAWLKATGEKLTKAADENGGELTPEMLEQIAGGGDDWAWYDYMFYGIMDFFAGKWW